MNHGNRMPPGYTFEFEHLDDQYVRFQVRAGDMILVQWYGRRDTLPVPLPRDRLQPVSDDPLDQGYERRFHYVLTAVEERYEPRTDWRDGITDVVAELERIIWRARRAKKHRLHYSADDLTNARLAMAGLAGIWLDDDENETLYLGGEQP